MFEHSYSMYSKNYKSYDYCKLPVCDPGPSPPPPPMLFIFHFCFTVTSPALAVTYSMSLCLSLVVRFAYPDGFQF